MSVPAVNTRSKAVNNTESTQKKQTWTPVVEKTNEIGNETLPAEPTPAELKAKRLEKNKAKELEKIKTEKIEDKEAEKAEEKTIKAPTLHQFLHGKIQNLIKDPDMDLETLLMINEKTKQLTDDSQFDNIVRDSKQEIMLGRLDKLATDFNRDDGLLKTSADLYEKAQKLKKSSEKEDFLKELSKPDGGYEHLLSKNTNLVISYKDKIKFILNNLNQLTVIASASQIKLRDEFTAKWNSLCLTNYRLKLELNLIKQSVQLLPELVEFFKKVDEINGAVGREKHDWQDKKDWTGLDVFFSSKLTEFDGLTKEGSEFNNKFKDFVIKEFKQDIVFEEEFLEGYALHNNEVKNKVKNEMLTIIKDINAKRKTHWISLFNQMEQIHQELVKLGYRVDHIKSLNATNINWWKCVAAIGSTFLQFYSTKVAPNFALDYSLKPAK